MEKAIRHIHKDFMKNKDAYLDTIKYWDRHVLNVLKDPSFYKTWLNNKSKNGSLIIDGNPIYSLIKKDKSQAVRIVQEEPRSKKPFMQAWTEIYDEGEDGENLPVLVIALELSNKTSMDTLTLIENWFDGYDKNKFDRLVASVNKKYEKNYTKSDTEIRLEAHEKLKEITHTKVVGQNNVINTVALQHFYTLHTTWEKDYSKRIAELNTDLAKTISLYITTLFTLVKNSATLKAKKQASIHVTHRRSDTNASKNYPVSGFQNIYFSITTELEKLNENLIEGIEEDAIIER